MKTLDTLGVSFEVQAKSIRMTLNERKKARELMKEILKTDKKRPTLLLPAGYIIYVRKKN